MATINKLDNTASIVYNGATINSNTVSTLLLLAPTVLKAVDKLTADIGDTLTYTVTITNISLSAVNSLPFSDTLPAGCDYVADSFTVNGSKVTPAVTGNKITYTIPSIPAAGNAVITFQVLVKGSEN